MGSKNPESKALQKSGRMFRKGREIYNQAGFSFVHTELELAKTFCDLARRAPSGSDKRQRNITNAKKAYQGALDVLSRLSLSPDELTLLKQLAGGVRQELACI